MIEGAGDIWPLIIDTEVRTHFAICITTNGFVKKDGRLVMGKGIAAEVVQKVPGIDLRFGTKIREEGHKTQCIERVPYTHLPFVTTMPLEAVTVHVDILSFPVKPARERCDPSKEDQIIKRMRKSFEPRQWVPGWACTARLDMIRRSCEELLILSEQYPEWEVVRIPRPGCGNGELSWEDQVRPILAEYLTDSKFVVYSF